MEPDPSLPRKPSPSPPRRRAEPDGAAVRRFGSWDYDGSADYGGATSSGASSSAMPADEPTVPTVLPTIDDGSVSDVGGDTTEQYDTPDNSTCNFEHYELNDDHFHFAIADAQYLVKFWSAFTQSGEALGA